jgi:hypothetical protein
MVPDTNFTKNHLATALSGFLYSFWGNLNVFRNNKGNFVDKMKYIL